MKKGILAIGSLLIILVIIGSVGFALGSQKTASSSKASSTSSRLGSSTVNSQASSNSQQSQISSEVSTADSSSNLTVEQAREELQSAGYPVDNFSDGDIKKMINQALSAGVPFMDYVNNNVGIKK